MEREGVGKGVSSRDEAKNMKGKAVSDIKVALHVQSRSFTSLISCYAYVPRNTDLSEASINR